MKILTLIIMLFCYLVFIIHNTVLLHRINKAREFIEKHIELNNSFLPNAAGQLHDLVKIENDMLTLLKQMLEGEEK